MNRIQKQKAFLKFLNSTNVKQRKVLIKNASPEQKRILIEIVLNILNGNVPLSSKQKKNLQKYKTSLRNMCRYCLNSKKKIINVNKKRVTKSINQIGGALPLLHQYSHYLVRLL